LGVRPMGRKPTVRAALPGVGGNVKNVKNMQEAKLHPPLSRDLDYACQISLIGGWCLLVSRWE
jgi:hypothetical protein